MRCVGRDTLFPLLVTSANGSASAAPHTKFHPPWSCASVTAREEALHCSASFVSFTASTGFSRKSSMTVCREVGTIYMRILRRLHSTSAQSRHPNFDCAPLHTRGWTLPSRVLAFYRWKYFSLHIYDRLFCVPRHSESYLFLYSCHLALSLFFGLFLCPSFPVLRSFPA